jgi:predicted component of type VI protein secretion system
LRTAFVITLRLFRQSDPFHQIEARTLDQGEIVLGRDAGVDWPLADDTRMLSRRHCVIGLEGTRLTLRNTSANGVLIGETREAAPRDEPWEIEPTEVLRLGEYLIVVESDEDASAQPRPDEDMLDAPFLAPLFRPADTALTDVSVPSEWGADAEPASPHRAAVSNSDGSLLEAFCEGAHLDASVFSGEEADAVMRRLGAVYQQMVLGLTDLMSERTTVKTQYRMDRTTVRSGGNNPFRWAGAQRVAVDLLRGGGDEFLSGPAAVQASFGDMKKHLLCMMDGLRAALAATLDGLSPEAVEARVSGQSFFLKGKGAAAWAEFAAMHDQFCRETNEDPDGVISREFRAAYARRLAELDARGAGA